MLSGSGRDVLRGVSCRDNLENDMVSKGSAKSQTANPHESLHSHGLLASGALSIVIIFR